MNKPIPWPTGDGSWWWMRWRKSRRGKWRTMLVQFFVHEDMEWFAPFENNNAYSRGCCESLSALFLPAEAPPKDWDDS